MKNNASFGQGTPQSVFCPYCHSPHTQLIQSHQLSTQSNSSSMVAFSPMALANIGMQVSKRLNLPPMLGGLTGLVVGGVVLLFLNHQKPIQVLQYQCEQCQESFEIHGST